MCGIYGILGRPELKIDRGLVQRMGEVTHHRGPDGTGFFGDEQLMMGMNRLAIIDVEGGQQPIFNEEQSVVVVCNGEIYNFRELRKDLEARGHRFSTGSDTEVIVHLYEEYGDDCINHLSGMFAFAIWDRRNRRLLLARDKLGIKPLYVAECAGRLLFASELKSILEFPEFRREINPEALREYLALGYVPAPLCMLKGVEKLLPGMMLVADESGGERRQYFNLCTDIDSSRDESSWAGDLAAEMENAVVSQMVSDVPLGAFLSGGVDSSAVVAFMARNSDKPVKTYSIGFDTDTGGGYYNELPYARRVAELFKTEHREIVVRPDVSQLLPELLWHMDEPIADAALITTYLVSKFAREDVTVILSGVGGDELFGGYRRYWSEYLARMYRRVPAPLRKYVLQPVSQLFPSDRHSRVFDTFRLAKGFMAGAELSGDERYEEYIRVFNGHDLQKILPGAVTEESAAIRSAFAAASTDDPLARLIEVDLRTQMPDDLLMLTDRMSMATSLECRVPLLDDRLLNLALRMPSSMKVRGTQLKRIMKSALRGVLPDDIIDRKKRGFGAPIGGWFKRELSSYLDSVLSEQRVRERGVFDWDRLQQMKQLHNTNRQDYTDHLLSMMNFEIWCQMYLDGAEPHAVTSLLAAEVAA